MGLSYPLFEFNSKAIALAAAAIITVVFLGAAVTATNAQQQEQQQQQQQLSTSQTNASSSAAAENATATATTPLFESTKDSFRVQLPEGWVIQDINNTGFTLAAEVTQGYGILAELCPEGVDGQQQGAPTNVSSSGSSSCQQQPQGEIVHIIRYPNLGNRLGIAVGDIRDTIPDSILQYHIRTLQGVGYRDINIVNSTDTRLNIHYVNTEDVGLPKATVPARLVEMTYSTASAPNEIRRGYFILTSTNVTPPNPETITGYSIFYESASGATTAEQTTTPSGNSSIPTSFRQIVDTFELMPSQEAEQVILAAIAQQAVSNEPNDQVEDEAGEAEGDNGE
jgi:hypothetical protein